MKYRYSLMFFSCLSLFSCKHEPIIPGDPAVTFSMDIQPMITGNCNSAGCHDGDPSSPTFGLLTYNDVINNGGVVAKDAKHSKLYNAVTANGEEIMPKAPSAPLTDKQQKLIYVWIMQGAKNN